MRVVASDQAVTLIEEKGGRLYVWPKRGRCSGGVTTLASATAPPADKHFRLVESDSRFELYLPASLTRTPDELQIELRRFPRRIDAYWNGCAWVV
jgi:hypothetical protein